MIIDTNKLAKYIVANTRNKRLFVSIPLFNWKFGSDNIKELIFAVRELNEPTPIIIKQFTQIDSSIPYKTDPQKFLPMKRVIAGNIDKHNTYLFDKAETKLCFETCSETGVQLPSIKDYHYIEPESLFGELNK